MFTMLIQAKLPVERTLWNVSSNMQRYLPATGPKKRDWRTGEREREREGGGEKGRQIERERWKKGEETPPLLMESVGPEAWTFLNVPSQLLQLANFFKAEEYSSLSLSLLLSAPRGSRSWQFIHWMKKKPVRYLSMYSCLKGLAVEERVGRVS